jgi:hypothetical protein
VVVTKIEWRGSGVAMRLKIKVFDCTRRDPTSHIAINKLTCVDIGRIGKESKCDSDFLSKGIFDRNESIMLLDDPEER